MGDCRSKNRETLRGAKPYFTDESIREILKAVEKTLVSGRLILGPQAKAFEEAFAAYAGTRFAVSVNTCTTALEIVWRYIGVKDGEVIVPGNTFVATANTVFYAGGKPVFAEMDESLCLDLEDVKKKMTPRTRAVCLVHVAGLISAKIDELRELCSRRGVVLVEDCAHAAGSALGGRKAGSFGLAGCFSFYATKVMTTGTGGMLTTDDEKLRDFADSFRYHGLNREMKEVVHWGRDASLNEILACVGMQQLKDLEENIRLRTRAAGFYDERLRAYPGCMPVSRPEGLRHSFYKYVVLFREPRDVSKLNERMRSVHKVETEFLYDPIVPLMPLYRDMGYREGCLPVTESILKRHICLPLQPFITEEEIRYAVECLAGETEESR
jgi:dTDP-4-amino-4,6-dideoxygalactose transaminase